MIEILSTKKDLVTCHECSCSFITTHMEGVKKVMLREKDFTYAWAYVCPVCRHYVAVYGHGTKPLKAQYENEKDIENILGKVFFDFPKEAISKIANVVFEEQNKNK